VATPAEAGRRRLDEQFVVLGRRAFLRVVRQPGQLIFPFVFPLVLFAINASGLDAATAIPGFPTEDYRDFALAFPFMQGALFIALNAGTDLARDIESGFLNRLRLTPMRAPALLAGQLGGVIAIAAIQAVVFALVGRAVGVEFASGIPGAIVLVALSIITGFAFAGIGALLALRFESAEAVQGFFPLMFVLVFLSSASMPRDLIEVDWFRTVATYNPVSYIIEGIRSLIITGWDGEALALGFGIAGGLMVVSVGAASVLLRRRVALG
jgi:ABC-2 type transport system permease protein